MNHEDKLINLYKQLEKSTQLNLELAKTNEKLLAMPPKTKWEAFKYFLKLCIPSADLPSLENAECNNHVFAQAAMKCITCNKCAHEFLGEVQAKQNENLKTWDELR